jgi:hypothetical protein
MSPFRAQPRFTSGLRDIGEQVGDLVLAIGPLVRSGEARDRSANPRRHDAVAGVIGDAAMPPRSSWRGSAR